jgi:hypothetical protein
LIRKKWGVLVVVVAIADLIFIGLVLVVHGSRGSGCGRDLLLIDWIECSNEIVKKIHCLMFRQKNYFQKLNDKQIFCSCRVKYKCSPQF